MGIVNGKGSSFRTTTGAASCSRQTLNASRTAVISSLDGHRGILISFHLSSLYSRLP